MWVRIGPPFGRIAQRLPRRARHFLNRTRWTAPDSPQLTLGTRPRGLAERIRVTAYSPLWLRWYAADDAATVRTRRVSIVVGQWQAPSRDWSGRLGPLPGVISQRTWRPRRGTESIRVSIRLEEPIELRRVIAAVDNVMAPNQPLPTPISSEVRIQSPAAAHLVAQPNVSVADGVPADLDSPDTPDLLLLRSGSHKMSTDGTRLHTIRSIDASDRVANLPIMIDATAINPLGRKADDGPQGRQMRIEVNVRANAWALTSKDGKRRTRGSLSIPLIDASLIYLRKVGVVDFAGVGSDDPAGSVRIASLAIQVAMTGAICTWPAMPADISALIGPELVGILTEPLPPDDAEPLVWELRSVRQRRAALREHSAGLVLRQSLGPHAMWQSLPAVSVLLTSRRPSYLAASIKQICAQTYPALELVLALHGDQMDGVDVDSLLAECSLPVHVVRIDGKLPFGDALASATARSTGSLITKFDDDDRYGSEHVWDLVLARHYSQATMVGKAADFVYLQDLDTTIRRSSRPEMYNTHLAGGTLLISRGDLEAAGGWRPVRRSIDVTLINRIRGAGGVLYRTHPIGYVLHRHGIGHTWDPGTEYFLDRASARWRGALHYPDFGPLPPEPVPSSSSDISPSGQQTQGRPR